MIKSTSTVQEFKSSYQPTSTLQTCSAGKILFSILGVFFFFFSFPSIWFNLRDEPFIWRKQPDNRKRVTYFFFSNKKLILLEERVSGSSRCVTCRRAIKIFITQQVRFPPEITRIFKIESLSKTSLWIKVIKKANYHCHNIRKHAEPDESCWQMRINLTVNKSAGYKCSFTRKYRRFVMSGLIAKTLQRCLEEEF